MVRELTAELWSFLPCRESWCCWERWCWEESTTGLPLAVAVVKQPQWQSVACMGGVWIWMYESNHHDWNTNDFHQRNRYRGSIKEWVLLCAVCGPYPATVICSCSLKAPCSRCDYIHIKISKLQTICYPCIQSLLDFTHLSWKSILFCLSSRTMLM